ncbi:MFS transporter [Proteinivorax hydrogeniformans]|uniref:MFS transporter n=1 Tax=Proteinivorax hydrogeniformans TaxID=1826727 RepID=A0AAU8HTY6_9FIRM
MGKVKSVPRSIQILYGVGVSYAIVDQIFAQWVLYYYLPPSDAGMQVIMAPLFISLALIISRFVDMIADPLVGYWSDKTDSSWGRRMPFIGLGALPLALATVAFFYPITNSDLSAFIYLAAIGSLFFVFYTIVGAPYNALIPEIAQNKEDRLNLATWQSVFRLIYTAIAMILPGMLIAMLGGGEQGIRYMVILLSSLAVVGMMVTVFTVKEREYSGGKRSDDSLIKSLKSIGGDKNFWVYLIGFMFFFLGFNILRASTNYYVVEIMGYGEGHITIASGLLFGSAALFFYPVNRLCQKIGYRKPMLWSLTLLMVFTLLLFNLGKFWFLPTGAGFVIFFLMGLPISGAAFIFPPAMLSEISAVNTAKKGENLEGMLFGLQGFFLKMAFLLSIAILPIVLVWGGDIPLMESIVSTPDGVQKTGVYATSIVAFVSFALSFGFYFRYREEKVED